MRTQLEKRLDELKAEFDKGQSRLKELESESNDLTKTLLRISGAIQVLEEELGNFDKSEMQHPIAIVDPEKEIG